MVKIITQELKRIEKTDDHCGRKLSNPYYISHTPVHDDVEFVCVDRYKAQEIVQAFEGRLSRIGEEVLSASQISFPYYHSDSRLNGGQTRIWLDHLFLPEGTYISTEEGIKQLRGFIEKNKGEPIRDSYGRGGTGSNSEYDHLFSEFLELGRLENGDHYMIEGVPERLLKDGRIVTNLLLNGSRLRVENGVHIWTLNDVKPFSSSEKKVGVLYMDSCFADIGEALIGDADRHDIVFCKDGFGGLDTTIHTLGEILKSFFHLGPIGIYLGYEHGRSTVYLTKDFNTRRAIRLASDKNPLKKLVSRGEVEKVVRKFEGTEIKIYSRQIELTREKEDARNGSERIIDLYIDVEDIRPALTQARENLLTISPTLSACKAIATKDRRGLSTIGEFMDFVFQENVFPKHELSAYYNLAAIALLHSGDTKGLRGVLLKLQDLNPLVAYRGFSRLGDKQSTDFILRQNPDLEERSQEFLREEGLRNATWAVTIAYYSMLRRIQRKEDASSQHSRWDEHLAREIADERLRKRFQVLTRSFDLDGKDLLDIGCGPYATLYHHLRNEGTNFKYVGTDINPQLIYDAREGNPKLDLRVFDATLDPIEDFDFVVGSGLFCINSFVVRENIDDLMNRLLGISRCAVAVNFRDKQRVIEHGEPIEPHIHYEDPEVVEAALRKAGASRVHIIRDYSVPGYPILEFTAVAEK